MQRDDKFGKDAIIETQVILELGGNFGHEREILKLVERVIHHSARRRAQHGCHLLRHRSCRHVSSSCAGSIMHHVMLKRWAGVSGVAPRRGTKGRLTRSAQVGQVGREEPVCA